MATAALTAISLGSTLIGGIFKAFGTAQEMSAQRQQLQYQAGIAKLNQQIMEQNKVHAIQAGGEQAFIEGLKGQQRMGHLRAAQAASGIDIAGPSSQAVQAGQHFANVENERIIMENARHMAYNYGAQGAAYGAQSKMYTAGATNVASATPIAVGASLLGTAGSVADKWLSASAAGIQIGRAHV